MRYYVRHRYRVSPNYNTYANHPWHGAGQGAADAALRYIALSDSLIDAYHSKFQPRILHDPTLTLQIIKSIKAFIDDVAMSASTDTNSFPQLVEQAQNQLQWWNRLVNSSGGALNPKKCFCATYYWKPDKYGILRLTNPDPQESAVHLDPERPHLTIPLLSIAEGTRYLGMYVTCNGATKPMENHIWKQAVIYTWAFQRTHMSRREATVLYRSCFLPAITYSFPATWLPQ